MKITSNTVVLSQENIDTDQIIPARFLTTTVRDGLGAHLFADWRESNASHLFDSAESRGCKILVAGHNFGCGSSREHAPWALLDFGIRAVISSGIADIFRQNALKNGLVPVVVDPEVHRWLVEHPYAEVTIDVHRLEVSLPMGQAIPFALDAFSRRCCLDGTDEMGFLLAKEAAISQFEATI